MTVENSNGQKEVLTDYQSFAAGYRSAVMDLTGRDGRPSFVWVVFVAVVVVILIRRLTSE